MNRAGRGAAAGGGAAPPESVAEALARARRHGRAASAEALAALRALLDAASLAARGGDAESVRWLAPLAQRLDALGARLGDEAGAAPLLEAIADALDAEIARWESRAVDDPDARAVLRAFLGVRELLWEFGVRRSGPPERDAPERPRTRSRRSGRRRGGPRVERVPVEG